MNPSTPTRRKTLKLGSLLRVLLPSLFTLILIVMLVVTMFFTDFDWQWVTFLTGILFAAVLSLISSSWKNSWRMARRTAEAAHFKQRLGAESEQHRAAREQLERELALHQQDRTRLARETEAHRLADEGRLAAAGLLGTLEQHLDEIAFIVDRDRRYRFHTKRFRSWTGAPSAQISGKTFEEALSQADAEALRPKLLDALDGRAGRAELTLAPRDGSGDSTRVDFLPQRDAAGKVSGVLVLIRAAREAGAAAAAQTPAAIEAAPAAEPARVSAEFVVSDESGNAVYLSSLTEELSGWGNPRERILQAIQNNGFNLYAQDIVALRAEANPRLMHELLIRMSDEEQNLVPPGTFLPIAERYGMMPDIDRFVVMKAVAARVAAGTSAMPVLCINLARASIEDPSFPEFVARALQESGIAGGDLCFEISDNDAITCLSHASRLAYELKPLGCRFSLDGFGRLGVGFDHIKKMPLDFLKIDGSIILQIERLPEALAKVRAIQRVCKVIGIRTIAEMVESDESLEKLRAVEVDYVQGFGIAKPRPF
ncbi:MAG: EAL domain-containing protein [Proteobacteria bacterium]|nr:EAL domain-containing protein [Pseudomonadota bacterium]